MGGENRKGIDMSEQVERCETCRWYNNPRGEYTMDDPIPLHGDCRRYPPVHVWPVRSKWKDDDYEPHDDPFLWSFPVVEPDDWCGEWQEERTTDNAN